MIQVMVSAIVASVLLQGRVEATSPLYNAPVIPILTDERNQDNYGNYNFHYSAANGIQRQEEGQQNHGQQSAGGWR